MIEEKIQDAIDFLDKKLNEGKITFSSENAFVFHFAIELFKRNEELVIKLKNEIDRFK